MTEPETKALIDGWADNTEYTVSMTLKTGAGANRNKCTVLEVTDQTEEAPEAEAEAAAPAAAAKEPTAIPYK